MTPVPTPTRRHRSRQARRPAAALVALLAVAAPIAGCGGDDDAATADTTTTTEAAPTGGDGGDAGGAVEVRAVDYAFEDLPESVPAGTELLLHNASEAEVHEIVALRLPDGEDRTVEELVALPEEELDTLFTGPPGLVTVAGPGEDGSVAVGDGTLGEPGRYVLICAIPTGADPEAYFAAAEEGGEGPPEADGGPPHFVNGMVAELRVDD